MRMGQGWSIGSELFGPWYTFGWNQGNSQLMVNTYWELFLKCLMLL